MLSSHPHSIAYQAVEIFKYMYLNFVRHESSMRGIGMLYIIIGAAEYIIDTRSPFWVIHIQSHMKILYIYVYV